MVSARGSRSGAGTPRFAIGLDLGGTDLKAALVGPDGALTAFRSWPSRARESAGAPLEVMAAAALELRREAGADVCAVGLGCPGVIDPVSGALVGRTPHLPHWDSLPLRQRLADRLDADVVVENDANMAALAEHRAGAARGARVSLTVTIGTGVGCGIVGEQGLVRGAHGGAGELGHLPLDGRYACPCGVPGCVEPECSGSGLVARAREAGLDVADAEAVFAARAAGDARAARLIERMTDRLGALIASAVQLLDPEVVVIGGGVANAGETLLGPLRAAVGRYALESHARYLRIVRAELGGRAGTVGAGLAAWDLFQRREAGD
jgi:glucokinase